MKKQRFLIIDGNAILHRAWHALPPLKTKDGILINAAYGFTSILLKALKDLKPDYIAVTFDTKAPTARHEAYAEYKAKRVKQPDELYAQIPIIKEVLQSLGIAIYEKDGFEADDIIGTMAAKLQVQKMPLDIIIATGDLDTLQLVSDQVSVYTLKKGITETAIFDPQAVRNRYGLEPSQLVDMKAFAGDPSDNIKGIKGIGPKTAAQLLQTFGSLENIYQALDADDLRFSKVSARARRLLAAGKEDALFSKKLVQINLAVPLDFELKSCRFPADDFQKALPVFQKYEFKGLLAKLAALSGFSQGALWTAAPLSGSKPCHLISSEAECRAFLDQLEKQSAFSIVSYLTEPNFTGGDLLGLSFSFGQSESHYIPGGGDARDYLRLLKPIFENPAVHKYGYNLKLTLGILKKYDIAMEGYSFDALIAAYLLNPGERSNTLDNLVFSELGVQKKSLESLSAEELPAYACEEADYVFQLAAVLSKKIKEKRLDVLLESMELPLIPVLAEMEKNGVKLDTARLLSLSSQLKKESEELERKIYGLAGESFNINSTLQLKKILFEKLKIPIAGLKRIKTGISLSAGELSKIQGKHPIIELVLKYRELAKLISTYVDALPALINPRTGRLHTTFNQTITATGRLSSSDPNLQNIPVRTELGKEIRQAFIADSGYKLVSADYSQIELRIAASMAGDEKMIQWFKDGVDIHKITASEIYGVPIEEVTSEMRYAAKTINFGVLYGQGPSALAQMTGMSHEEAREFIERYFALRPQVKNLIEQTKQFAREHGYVQTLYGRVRYLTDIHSNVSVLRSAAERMAVNMPIQGTAADLVKLAMIRVFRELKGRFKPDEAFLLLQVHDELVFEVKEESVEKFAEFLKPLMENPGSIPLKTPIVVEIKAGDNWGEMERIS